MATANVPALCTGYYCNSWKGAIRARSFAHEAVTNPKSATREDLPVLQSKVFPYPFPELKEVANS